MTYVAESYDNMLRKNFHTPWRWKPIDYLGGDPTVEGEDEMLQDSKTMLEIDLRAERDNDKTMRKNPTSGTCR